MEIHETALTRTSPSSEKPPDRLPGRKYLWLATPATEQIGQDRNNALFQLAGRCGCPLKGHLSGLALIPLATDWTLRRLPVRWPYRAWRLPELVRWASRCPACL